MVDERREPLQRPALAQPVDAALDRRRRELDALGDVAVGAPPVLLQQRKNLAVDLVDATEYCAQGARQPAATAPRPG